MNLRFVCNDATVALEGVAPHETLLTILRERLGLAGSKEGCAEGDCGACTVLLGEAGSDKEVNWRAVNACILLAPMLENKAVLTVEGLGKPQNLHDVQDEMVKNHASQCGFCTPGFVMSLYGRAIGAGGTKNANIGDVLQGNLCRCTGYGPILRAGGKVRSLARNDLQTRDALDKLDHIPRFASGDDLADYLVAHPRAQIVAGATDVGLWVTKQLREFDDIVCLADIPEFGRIEEDARGLRLYAAVTFAEAREALARLHPELGELVRRIAGMQVRNMGTICGNIANGSPIGDSPPALIALGARLVLRRGAERRELPLEDFYLDYGKQDRQAGEFIESVYVPRPPPTAIYQVVKLSKRFDSDISAVLGAFHLDLEGGVVKTARIAFGGMSGTPSRARACEASLIGQRWDSASAERGAQALYDDFQPLDDVRGTASYRLEVAGNLLRRMALQGGASARSNTILTCQPTSMR